MTRARSVANRGWQATRRNILLNGFPTASPTVERTSNDGFFCLMTANISGIGQFMHLWTASAEL